jgi:hypothetical protein
MIVTLNSGMHLGDLVIPHEIKLTLPTVKFGVMGPPNTGKSHLVASMEYPLIVLLADPFEKAECYFDRGLLDPETYIGQFNQPIRIVKSAKSGNAIIQIENFLDPNPSIPWGFGALQNRLDQVAQEVVAGKWKSAGFDSWSQIEYIAKLRRTTGAFAGVDSIPAAVKDDCEQLIKSRICTLRCNVGVTLHVNSKMIDAGGGTMLYEPMATGTLKSGIGSVLGEMYRSDSIVDSSAPGGLRYVLQTLRDGRFDCGTRIGAPNGCTNDFRALFSNWIVRQARKVLEAEQSTNTAAPAAAEPAKESA